LIHLSYSSDAGNDSGRAGFGAHIAGEFLPKSRRLERNYSSCIPVTAGPEPGIRVFGSDGFEGFGNGVVQGFGGASLGRAQELFELGPGFFDGLISWGQYALSRPSRKMIGLIQGLNWRDSTT
jgi:hypothetical protein